MASSYHDVQIGDVFGRLTVLEDLGYSINPRGKKRKRFLVQCECGAKFPVQDTTLTQGYRTECGYCSGEMVRPAKYC